MTALELFTNFVTSQPVYHNSQADPFAYPCILDNETNGKCNNACVNFFYDLALHTQPAKKITKERKIKAIEGKSKKSRPWSCQNCSVHDTPLRRKGPKGKGTLCNRCAMAWKRRGCVDKIPFPISTRK